MQLDQTAIAIRERSMVETLDLAFHVLRACWAPLLRTMLLGIAPCAVVNYLLLSWMMTLVPFREGYYMEDAGPILRYVWNMGLLVFLEAPLASSLATLYLGQAVFCRQPRLWPLVVELGGLLPRVLWCQLVLRGLLLAWLLLLTADRDQGFSSQEAVLILLGVAAIVPRSLRPFINEILLLERSPFQSDSPAVVTASKRSAMLHNPSSGDLFVRWFGSAVVGGCLALSCYGLLLFCSGVLLNDWRPRPWLIHVACPVSFWSVATYFSVVRFLQYLDVRIRYEGWEVELTLRAEAARLAAGS